MPEPFVESWVDGHAGRLRLNRPEALNALTHDMVRVLTTELLRFAEDPSIRLVAIDGRGQRGFCAGGDIRAIYDDARGDRTASARFWADEYALNLLIRHFPKPYVAIMSGVVMGGGVGISSHGLHRIVTELTTLAMPEVAIGLVPDVGGTHLLARAPDNAGVHTALTAARLDAADAIYAGLADAYVPMERLPELLDSLARRPLDEALLLAQRELPGPSALQAAMRSLGRAYDAPTVAGVMDRLRTIDHSQANEAYLTMQRYSPTSLAVTHEAIRRVRVQRMDLRSALQQEYRIMLHALTAPDVVEGIRCRIIEKGQTPRWSPGTLSEVDPAKVEAFFAPLGSRELML